MPDYKHMRNSDPSTKTASINSKLSAWLPLAQSRTEAGEEEEGEGEKKRPLLSTPGPPGLFSFKPKRQRFASLKIRRDKMNIESTPPTPAKAMLLCLEFFD